MIRRDGKCKDFGKNFSLEKFRLFKTIVLETDSNSTYVPPASLNVILFLGSAPPDNYSRDIQNIIKASGGPVIGVLLDNTVKQK